MNLTLIIGNKNYSSWSMRPWVLLTQFGIPFTERVIKFDSEDWNANIAHLSPSRLVPVLWEGEVGNGGSGFATWDSLAIAERVAELFPDLPIWPREAHARARARCLAAEMHSGYRPLRMAMPMNIRARHPGKGHTPEALENVARIHSLWDECLTRHGGPFLFGGFSAADAMFAPVVSRFQTYEVKLDGKVRDYSQAMLAAPGMAGWIESSKAEIDFVAHDEPYATAPP